jgi:hypothetical protein
MKISTSLITRSAVVGAVFAVAACAGNGPLNVRGAVAPVPAGVELISFNAPGLSEASALRAEYKDNDQEEEYALFRGAGGAQAEVVSVEASVYGFGAAGGDYRVLDFDKTTRATLEMWNLAKAGKFAYSENSFLHKGKLPYYLLPFERKDTGQSCFGFHAEFNRDVHDRQGRFDNQLFGYYCAPTGTKLSKDAMISAIDGLNIAGLTKPAPVALADRPFQQLTNDAALVAAVKQGTPAGQAGIDAFPLYIARIYSDELGGPNEQR